MVHHRFSITSIRYLKIWCSWLELSTPPAAQPSHLKLPAAKPFQMLLLLLFDELDNDVHMLLVVDIAIACSVHLR